MSRGYSLVEKESVLITDSQQLRSGDFVEIRFASGSAKAEIVSLDNQTKSFSVFEEKLMEEGNMDFEKIRSVRKLG